MSILLLDEPTSSVDAKMERDIYKRLWAAYPDMTIVSSLHRLHLLSMFDYIYVFEHGRVVGAGTLEELLQSCHTFQVMWANYHTHNEEAVEALAA